MQPKSVNQPGTSAAPKSAGNSLPKEISRLPVEDFLELANWQGAPVAAAPVAAASVTAPVATPVANLPSAPASTPPTDLRPATTTGLAVEQMDTRENSLTPSPSVSPVLSPVPSPNAVDSWLCLTVEQFFARQNWQGLAKPPQPIATTAPTTAENAAGTIATTPVIPNLAPSVEPSLTLTVHEFFQHLPWEVAPAIGALPKAEAMPTASEPQMTISDLSDLF